MPSSKLSDVGAQSLLPVSPLNGSKGKRLEEANEITNSQIVRELSLPPVKIHCSVLAEDAIKAAIKDYEIITNQSYGSVSGA